MRYLDPKADLTFKRVFGEHPDLVISFLNALLPLHPGQEVREIEYLPTEPAAQKQHRRRALQRQSGTHFHRGNANDLDTRI